MLQVPYRTIDQPQLNNMIRLEQDLEMELLKVLFNLCFTRALHITIQYKVVAESEFHHSINLISLATLVDFASLFISQFNFIKLLHLKCWRKLHSSVQSQHFSSFFFNCNRNYSSQLIHTSTNPLRT
jgi:hypothetical protein